jgi:predicted O-methyltransferase YrrM
MRNDHSHGPILDARVNAVLERLQVARPPGRGGPRGNAQASRNPHDYAEQGFSISPDQGELIYLLCRGARATRVVEFATSLGVSTLYFAAAVRDNGGGTVIGSEIVPAKVIAARQSR